MSEWKLSEAEERRLIEALGKIDPPIFGLSDFQFFLSEQERLRAEVERLREVEKHPKPDLAQRIASAIEEDLDDRRGLGIGTCDPDIQDQIRDKWATLIRGILEAE